jgi:hypothetical protein
MVEWYNRKCLENYTFFGGVADYPDLAVRGKMGRKVESVVSVSVIIFLSELVRARIFYSELRARFFYSLRLGSSSSVMSSSDSSCDSLLEDGRFLNSDSSDDEEQETVDSTGTSVFCDAFEAGCVELEACVFIDLSTKCMNIQKT